MTGCCGVETVTHSPLFGITLTLGVYALAELAWRRYRRHPLLTPVFVAIVVIAGLLLALDIPYAAYLEGAQYIGFVLGPATVALAVTIYRHLPLITAATVPVLASVLVGSATGIAAGYATVRLLGGDRVLAVSMMAKSVTTPVSMALSEHAGGIPELTAAFTILTGVFGAVAAPTLFTLLGIHDRRVRGLAMGVSSHGIGTARALDEDPTEGAFSALGMALSTIAATILMPIALLLG